MASSVEESKGRITQSVEALQTALDADKTALENKGVALEGTEKHSDIPRLIEQIESGSGVSTIGYTIEKVEGYLKSNWDTSTGPTGTPIRTAYPQQNGIINMKSFFPFADKPVGLAVYLNPKPGYRDSQFFYGSCSVLDGGSAESSVTIKEIASNSDEVKYFTVSSLYIYDLYYLCPLIFFGYMEGPSDLGTPENGIYLVTDYKTD